MSTLLEFPATELADTDFHAFNLAVWEAILADKDLAALPYRIETDQHGQLIMSPPPAPGHGNKQIKIGAKLMELTETGEVVSECPISTRLGVKAADIAWCSQELWERSGEFPCFTECPEICVEVLSPSNTKGEIEEKKSLYFEAGAKEVWICDSVGEMKFFLSDSSESTNNSALVPNFPRKFS
ncbi:MAG: hypothetical protein CMO55_28390 [Verrucomicrobiales bacterium]|nr:hypothetical protein [Verrucomicrobiales bacterium]